MTIGFTLPIACSDLRGVQETNKNEPITENKDFYVMVDEMPELIGGIRSLQRQVEYPDIAQKAGIEGEVMSMFIVNKNGDVENAEIVRGIGYGCDEAFLRVLRKAKFKPGKLNGKPVPVRFALTIDFKL